MIIKSHEHQPQVQFQQLHDKFPLNMKLMVVDLVVVKHFSTPTRIAPIDCKNKSDFIRINNHHFKNYELIDIDK
ncbi:CLUMA_CG012467, isoform A [Clunio marinus]|uniref:CLUMA_CG012467, isoform A n=1 Tax=Clunio marinus TaxID=568069 RepID=A0A1J1IFR4_9DIPT|nr:CLUMA_CG012467, isoform A [Clunio marinus]